MKEKISLTAGSTKQYLEKQAAKNILINKEKKPFHLKLKINNKIIDKEIGCCYFVYSIPEEKIAIKNFGNKIKCIKIPAWEGNISEDILEEKAKYLAEKKIKALIIDVRGNSGGNSNIAKSFVSHFFNNKTLFSITKKRISKNNFELEENQAFVIPKKPFLDIPVIVLIDALCFSSNLVQTNILLQG